MKFDVNLYPGRVAMRCTTVDEARTFLSYLDSVNRRWSSGKRYTQESYWRDYHDDACYAFNEGTVCRTSYYQSRGYVVLDFTDYEWASMLECQISLSDVDIDTFLFS